MYKPSGACCSTPAIIGPPYTPKGTFVDVDGTKTYVTGPGHAKKAIFVLYDIFGFSSQILEGADKLGATYRVFMPGFFGDSPCPLHFAPIDGEMDEAKIDEWVEEHGDTDETLERMNQLMKTLQKDNTEITSWGVVGYCWGGWIANVAISRQHTFKAAAVLHAGFPEAEDAAKIRTPVLALNSKDETEDQYAVFQAALTVNHRFENFTTMVHGWLSARGDLANPDVRAKFDEGYDMILEWLRKYL